MNNIVKLRPSPIDLLQADLDAKREIQAVAKMMSEAWPIGTDTCLAAQNAFARAKRAVSISEAMLRAATGTQS